MNTKETVLKQLHFLNLIATYMKCTQFHWLPEMHPYPFLNTEYLYTDALLIILYNMLHTLNTCLYAKKLNFVKGGLNLR